MLSLAQGCGTDNALLPVLPGGIPAELRAVPRWVGWLLEPRGSKKPAKRPICPRTGKLADVTNPAHFVGFDDALAYYQSRCLDGIGFGLFAADPFAGVDIDSCRDPDNGIFDSLVADLLAQLDTYAEVSPSGTGARAIGIGKLDPAGRKKSGNLELYDRARFLTLTGHRIPTAPLTIEPREAALRQLQELLRPPQRPLSGVTGVGGFDGCDHELLARAFSARNGPRVRTLWAGRHNKPSASEALLGLARLLAFWTGPDTVRLERLMIGSPLFAVAEAQRQKWSARRGDASWGRRYIVAKAIDTCPEFCSGILSRRSESSGESRKKTHPCVSSSSHLGGCQNDAANPFVAALKRLETGPPPAHVTAIESQRKNDRDHLRKLAAVIWDLCDRQKGGRCRISIEACARAFHVGKSSVSRWLDKLQSRGVIRRTIWGSTHTGLSSEWMWMR